MKIRKRLALNASIAMAIVTLAMLAPAASASAASCATPIAAGPYGAPIWCQSALVPGPYTAHSGPNWWSDDFGYTGRNAAMNGYKLWEGGGPSPADATNHFLAGTHWHTDIDGNGQYVSGVVMRPDHAFGFDSSGTLEVTTEVAPGLLDYAFSDNGSMAWTELIVTNAAQPSSLNGEGLYARDFFQGNWVWSLEFFGSTASASGGAITAQDIDNGSYTPGTEHNYICKVDAFEDCGGHKTGFVGTLGGLYPQCPRGADPDNCYVRIRLKLTAHGGVGGSSTMDVYLAPAGSSNFQLYGHDEGFNLNPALTQAPIYVYQGDYQYLAPGPVRFHWDYFDVNPQDFGSFQPIPSTPASGGAQGAAGQSSSAQKAQPSASTGSSIPDDGGALIDGSGSSGVHHAAAARSSRAGVGAAFTNLRLELAAVTSGVKQPLFWVLLAVLMLAAAAGGFLIGQRRGRTVRPGPGD
ncbi:MAG TPA: hypothetical protein VKF59_12790 [Candidatus Dormibacteraeota bacterium]|nr:hypothetical protein [Candidatus Dormibacteraeota bacterium]